MKWTFAIEQKLKAAVLLAILIVLIVVTTILERKQIQHIDQYSNSMYKDRLVPATEFFFLSENLYNKRLLVEKFFVSTEQTIEQLRTEISLLNQNIDSIIVEYEKTFLVDQESIYLKDFKKLLSAYEAVEHSVLALSGEASKAAGQQLYEDKGKPLLISITKDLHRLMEIQTQVGQELMNNSRDIVASANLISTLQIIVAIVIGIILQALVFSSKMISPRIDDNQMN